MKKADRFFDTVSWKPENIHKRGQKLACTWRIRVIAVWLWLWFVALAWALLCERNCVHHVYPPQPPDSIGFIRPLDSFLSSWQTQWFKLSQLKRSGQRRIGYKCNDVCYTDSLSGRRSKRVNIWMLTLQEGNSVPATTFLRFLFSIFMFCSSLIINSTQQHFSAAYQRWMSVHPRGYTTLLSNDISNIFCLSRWVRLRFFAAAALNLLD